MKNLSKSLIDVHDSLLIVIDVQDYFLAKLPDDERQQLVNRIAWLVSVASKLSVPIVVTAEDIPRWGSVTAAVAARLPPGTRVFNKMVFGLAEDEEIMAAVRETGRGTAILVGLETDVCIAHSALGLFKKGYQVAVVADASGSPGTGHRVGLERVRGAVAVVTSVKSLYFEWVRTVERDNEFMAEYEKKLGPLDIML
jgi:nicotinamidase-related amidase